MWWMKEEDSLFRMGEVGGEHGAGAEHGAAEVFSFRFFFLFFFLFDCWGSCVLLLLCSAAHTHKNGTYYEALYKSSIISKKV